MIDILFIIAIERASIQLCAYEIQSKESIFDWKSATQKKPCESFDLDRHINCPYHFPSGDRGNISNHPPSEGLAGVYT